METTTLKDTKWSIDPVHSEIGFKVKHMMFTNVSGKFENYDANIISEGDNFEDATIEFTADVNSINTNNKDRDNHLRSADFFHAEQYPRLNFRSSELKKIDDDNYEMYGDLTIRGVTKPVKLDVEFGGFMKDPWGNYKAALNIKGKLNRKEWGLNWNAALEAGGVLVSEEVKLISELQLVRNN